MSPALPASPTRRSVLVRAALDRLLDVLARREVHGVEHLPREGPCLVVFNQASILDTPLVSVTVPRRDVTGLVALDYRTNPLYRVLVESGGGMWIRRRSGDRAALRAALGALERGWVVGISPEGRRSPTGALVEARPGPAFLAKRSGVPVVPVAFTGTRLVAASLPRLRRTRVVVRVGEPFRLAPFSPGPHGAQLRAGTDEIMCRLAALLPHSCRGVYAGHPRVAALSSAAAAESLPANGALS